jgi:hypothetical protein
VLSVIIGPDATVIMPPNAIVLRTIAISTKAILMILLHSTLRGSLQSPHHGTKQG